MGNLNEEKKPDLRAQSKCPEAVFVRFRKTELQMCSGKPEVYACASVGNPAAKD